MLEAAGVPPERRACGARPMCRYRRQAYELTVPMADGPITRDEPRRARRVLPRRAPPDLWPRQPGRAGAARQPAADRDRPLAGADPAPAWRAVAGPTRERSVVVRRDRVRRLPGALARRSRRGASLTGPAIVEALDTTIVIPPGWTARSTNAGISGCGGADMDDFDTTAPRPSPDLSRKRGEGVMSVAAGTPRPAGGEREGPCESMGG